MYEEIKYEEVKKYLKYNFKIVYFAPPVMKMKIFHLIKFLFLITRVGPFLFLTKVTNKEDK